MPLINRREFAAAALVLGAHTTSAAAGGIDETLRASVKRRKIPAAVAMAATAETTLYENTFGGRDSSSNQELTSGSIFRIASMTKAITSVAAMQLVERGTLSLDEPVAKRLRELEGLQVLEGFDTASGDPILRPARKPVTLRRLLTHTAGFAYDTWDANLLRYVGRAAAGSPDAKAVAPLMSEPGTRWEYGTNIDWTGRLVENVSGQTLEAYFQTNILRPLGMQDTGFNVPADKFDRLVSSYQRQADGSLKENPRTPPDAPRSFNGGGGLFSTARDYVRFMQMILHRGRSGGAGQILRADTVAMMTTNQIGEMSAGKMKSVRPDRSSDVDFHPLRKAAIQSVLDWHYASQTQSPVEVAIDFKLPEKRPGPGGIPMMAPNQESGRLSRIQVMGISPALRDAVTSSLTVRVGDLIEPGSLTLMRQAVKEIDEHLDVRYSKIPAANGGSDYALQIFSTSPMDVPASGIPGRIRVGGNLQATQIISGPSPVYPPLPKQARIQGVVKLSVIIGKDGTIQDLKAISGHPLLVPASLEAVRQWIYKPTLLNGQPVEVDTVVDVNFTLSQ